MAMRARVRFTADDIWDAPDDGNRYEVIDGELYVSPPPLEPHQFASGTLFGYLWTYIHERHIGRLYSAPFGVKLDDDNGLQPDLVYVSRERAGLITERGLEGAPGLAIEILSPSTRSRDRGIKMKRYAASGVPHYCIVDPRSRILEAFRLTEDGYELVDSRGPGTVFQPELFPGLKIPIDELWA